MNPRTTPLALLALVVLAAPRPAGACTSSTPSPGLTVRAPEHDRHIASDGVLAFDAFIRAEAPEVALARFSLTLTPDAGGPAITGTTSHRTLARGPEDDPDDGLHIVLVWRPAAPLAPGAYTAEVTEQQEIVGARTSTFPVVVDPDPAPPLSPPNVMRAVVDEFDDEALERACCEIESTCGGDSMCAPTRVRVVPGFSVNAALEPADIERAYLWIAPWDGQAPGLPFERRNPSYDFPQPPPWWPEWNFRHPVRLPDADGERCIVVGATSLIDGSVALSAPICGELTPAHEEAREPSFPLPSDAGHECLTPPVYEHDGSPYPAQSDGGCRLAAGAPCPFALLLLLAAGRRRRRPA